MHVGIRSDDLVRDVAAAREQGADIGELIEIVYAALRRERSCIGSRQRPDRMPACPPLCLVEPLTPPTEQASRAAGPAHPNRVLELERAYIVTSDLDSAVAACAALLGLPRPPLRPGTVGLWPTGRSSRSDRTVLASSGRTPRDRPRKRPSARGRFRRSTAFRA